MISQILRKIDEAEEEHAYRNEMAERPSHSILVDFYLNNWKWIWPTLFAAIAALSGVVQ